MELVSYHKQLRKHYGQYLNYYFSLLTLKELGKEKSQFITYPETYELIEKWMRILEDYPRKKNVLQLSQSNSTTHTETAKPILKELERILYVELLHLAFYVRASEEGRKKLAYKSLGRGTENSMIQVFKKTIRILKRTIHELESNPDTLAIAPIPVAYIQDAIKEMKNLQKNYEPGQREPTRITNKTVMIRSANIVYDLLCEQHFKYKKDIYELISIYFDLCGHHVSPGTIKVWIQKGVHKKEC